VTLSNIAIGLRCYNNCYFFQFTINLLPCLGKQTEVDAEDRKYIIDWLEMLPTVESHYCRNINSYTEKKFLYPGTTISQLYGLYKESAIKDEQRVVSIAFLAVFHDNDFSVFIPQKDQCDKCVAFKDGNLSDAEYQAHVAAKDETRTEKKDEES